MKNGKVKLQWERAILRTIEKPNRSPTNSLLWAKNYKERKKMKFIRLPLKVSFLSWLLFFIVYVTQGILCNSPIFPIIMLIKWISLFGIFVSAILLIVTVSKKGGQKLRRRD